MQFGKLFSVTVWACILHVRLAFMQITTRKAICSIREASKLAEISVVGTVHMISLL